ncbi:MAG: tetratricopeptide repeat protein, partial [Anaerolineales bacterium]|nr:tetratricopeptide repeat protein [Anaerolineales bacterium]
MAKLAMVFLGAFHVTFDGQAVARFGTDKTRALLAYLALESERAHRREMLAAMLWPDQADAAARHSLRQALLRLRGAISDSEHTAFLSIAPETIAFNRASSHWLDVSDFSALVQACHRHTHTAISDCAACVARLRQAVELYRGELLKDLFIGESPQFEEWVLVRRELLHRQMLESFDALTTYHAARGEYARTREYAARQIELEPWHEEAHRALMDAFAREGQRGAALAQYEVCRKILAREFNAAPSEETTRLHEKIRAGAFESRIPSVSASASRDDAWMHDASNVDALAALAQYSLAQGDLARAHAYQIQVLEQRSESGDKHALAAAHQQLGVILQRQDKLDTALAHLRDALALRENIGDQVGLGESLNALAQVWEQQGDLAAAQEYFRRALKNAEATGDPVATARVLTHLGALYHRQKKFTDARACFQRALEIQTRIGNRTAMA